MLRNAHADAGTPTALTCADVRAREWDFVEGSLPTPLLASLQTHLDGCAACRREILFCRSAEGVLRTAPAQIPPAGDLRTGFYSRLVAEQRRPRRYGRLAAVFALAAGVLALALARPALHPAVGPSTDPTPANLAVNSARSPSEKAFSPATPKESVNIADFNIVSGPTNARAIVRLASEGKTRRSAPQHRIASRRPRSHINLAQLDRAATGRSRRSALLTMNGLTPRSYQYFVPDPGKDEAALLAKTSPGLSALALEPQASSVAQADVRDSKAEPEQIAMAMSGEAGVSLEVTDHVRGFSNTTHVASDIEVQGGKSTIHVEADGN